MVLVAFVMATGFVVFVAARAVIEVARELAAERSLADSLAYSLAEIQETLADLPVDMDQIERVRLLAGNVAEWYDLRGVDPV
jgi:hypothetical protein